MRRRLCRRVDGDDFEISVVAQLHHVVMGTHGLMQPAHWDLHPEAFANIVDTLFQGVRGDNQMI